MLVRFNPDVKFTRPKNYEGGRLIRYTKKQSGSLNGNRPLEILIIHSELICQNDAIQEITKQVRVPKRYPKFRFEKLIRVGRVVMRKDLIMDYDWFMEYRN